MSRIPIVLKTGMPATGHIQDAETRRVLDAIKSVLMQLGFSLDEIITSAVLMTPDTELTQGQYVRITRQGRNKFRIAVELPPEDDNDEAEADLDCFVNMFKKTGKLTGDWTTGKVYIDGIDTIIDKVPSTITVDEANIIFWIEVNLSTKGAAWGSGKDLPANTATMKYYRVLVCTTSGSSETLAIDSFLCPQPDDIYVSSSSSLYTLQWNTTLARLEYSTDGGTSWSAVTDGDGINHADL